MSVELHHTKIVTWSMAILFVLIVGTPIGFLCYYKNKYEMLSKTVDEVQNICKEQKEVCKKFKNIAIFHRESAAYMYDINERLVRYLHDAKKLVADYDARLKACQSVDDDSNSEIELVENSKESMIGGEEDE